MSHQKQSHRVAPAGDHENPGNRQGASPTHDTLASKISRYVAGYTAQPETKDEIEEVMSVTGDGLGDLGDPWDGCEPTEG